MQSGGYKLSALEIERELLSHDAVRMLLFISLLPSVLMVVM